MMKITSLLKWNLLLIFCLGGSSFAQDTFGDKASDQLLHLISQLDLGTQVGLVQKSQLSQPFVAVFDAKGQLINVRAWRPHRKNVFDETGRDIGRLYLPYTIWVAADGSYRASIAPIGWHNTDFDARLSGSNVSGIQRTQRFYRKLEFFTFTVDDHFSYTNLKTQTLDYLTLEITNPVALNRDRTTFLSELLNLTLSLETTQYIGTDGKEHEFAGSPGPLTGGITNGQPTSDGSILGGVVMTKYGLGFEFMRITRSGLHITLSTFGYVRAGSGYFYMPEVTAANQQLLNQYNAAEAQYLIDIKPYETPPGNNGTSSSSNASHKTTAMPVAPTPPAFAPDNWEATRYTTGLNNVISVKKRINARSITHRAISLGLKGEYNPTFDDGIYSNNVVKFIHID